VEFGVKGLLVDEFFSLFCCKVMGVFDMFQLLALFYCHLYLSPDIKVIVNLRARKWKYDNKKERRIF